MTEKEYFAHQIRQISFPACESEGHSFIVAALVVLTSELSNLTEEVEKLVNIKQKKGE